MRLPRRGWLSRCRHCGHATANRMHVLYLTRAMDTHVYPCCYPCARARGAARAMPHVSTRVVAPRGAEMIPVAVEAPPAPPRTPRARAWFCPAW